MFKLWAYMVPKPASKADETPPVADAPAETADEQINETTDAPVRRELDEGVADILKEEASRETAERVAEGSALETQTDMALDAGSPNDGDIDAPEADQDDLPEGELAEANIAATIAGATRKDILPDIEEINSTLKPSDENDPDDPVQQEKRKRSGFRRGFIWAMVVFALAALIYVFAPKIIEMVPALETMMNAYVEWVNALRIKVDQMLMSAVEKLTGLLTQLNGSDDGATG